jgi:hypothetical protein
MRVSLKELKDDMKTVTLHEAHLDEVTLQDYRAGSSNPTFSITLPSDNVLTSSECPSRRAPIKEQ